VSDGCGDMAMNLHDAVANGDAAKVRRLVAAGADVDEPWGEFGWAPLHYAARCGHVDVIKVLMELGADKEPLTTDGATPLNHAAQHGHVEAIRVLVGQFGANKEAKDAQGATPLHYAVDKGQVEVIKLLVQLGVDKDVRLSMERRRCNTRPATGTWRRSSCWCSWARTKRRMLRKERRRFTWRHSTGTQRR
jgi:ankyrin repeat protein